MCFGGMVHSPPTSAYRRAPATREPWSERVYTDDTDDSSCIDDRLNRLRCCLAQTFGSGVAVALGAVCPTQPARRRRRVTAHLLFSSLFLFCRHRWYYTILYIVQSASCPFCAFFFSRRCSSQISTRKSNSPCLLVSENTAVGRVREGRIRLTAGWRWSCGSTLSSSARLC